MAVCTGSISIFFIYVIVYSCPLTSCIHGASADQLTGSLCCCCCVCVCASLAAVLSLCHLTKHGFLQATSFKLESYSRQKGFQNFWLCYCKIPIPLNACTEAWRASQWKQTNSKSETAIKGEWEFLSKKAVYMAVCSIKQMRNVYIYYLLELFTAMINYWCPTVCMAEMVIGKGLVLLCEPYVGLFKDVMMLAR